MSSQKNRQLLKKIRFIILTTLPNTISSSFNQIPEIDIQFEVNCLKILKNQIKIQEKLDIINKKLDDREMNKRLIFKYQKVLEIISSTPLFMISSLPLPTFKQRKALKRSYQFGVGKGKYKRSGSRKIQKKRKNHLKTIEPSLYPDYINLTSDMFSKLLNKVRSNNCKINYGSSKLTMEEKVFTTLRYFKGGNSLSILGNELGVSPSTLCKCITESSISLMTALSNEIKVDNLSSTEPHPALGTSGSIDHTHFTTGKSDVLQREKYRKDKGHANIAMVVVNREGLISYFNSGFRGASNDNRVVALSDLNNISNFKLNADGGFRSTHLNLIHPKNIPENASNALLKYERVIVEICNAYIKRFGILNSNWGNKKKYFQSVVSLVCAQLTNLFLREGTIRDKSIIEISDRPLNNE
jgi:hypothetical protein